MEPIRVAIVGGSIAGCTLANGLNKHDNVIFDVYDAKAAFGERGMAVDLAINAQNALDAIGLDALEMFRNTGAVKGEEEPYSVVAMGEHTGKRLYQTPPGIRRNVMRPRWLAELIKSLPQERLHSNKSLTSIEEPDQGSNRPYVLHFKDGTSAEADAIIGCDGLRSKVRDIMLNSESNEPRFAGYWDTRASTTPDKAAEFMGKELFDPTRKQSVAMTGIGSFMLFSPSDDGSRLGVIMSGRMLPEYATTDERIPLSKEFLERHFAGWDAKFRNGVIKCLLEDPTGPGVVWTQWESAPASTYCRNGIAMMGDAAHAICPYMGQGANMAMEDAAVMSAVLSAVRSRAEVPAALKAFDAVRRGRPEQMGVNSKEMARLATGQITMDPSEVTTKSKFNDWWEYAYRGVDIKDSAQEAVKEFQSLKQGGP